MALKEEYDVIIVGSGAAGGTLIYYLSKHRPDLKFALIEKGGVIKNGEEGKFWPFFLKHYRRFGMLNRSKEGVVIYAAEVLGGSTTVSCGNAVRSSILEKRFEELGIDLSAALLEAEKELMVKPMAGNRRIGGSAKIMEAAQDLG